MIGAPRMLGNFLNTENIKYSVMWRDWSQLILQALFPERLRGSKFVASKIAETRTDWNECVDSAAVQPEASTRRCTLRVGWPSGLRRQFQAPPLKLVHGAGGAVGIGEGYVWGSDGG